MFLGDQIHQQEYVESESGVKTELHSHASKGQCDFLYSLVREVEPKTCVETGLAFGLSSLYICKALREVNGERHIIIDKFQSGETWNNIGITNLKRAGFEDLVQFHEALAHEVLPDLCARAVRTQFAFLDASKNFDVVLVNMYFIDLMLDVDGLMVLDDCDFPGVKKLVSFWSNHPNYKLHSTFGERPRNLKSSLRNMAASVVSRIPKGEKIFHPYLVQRPPDTRTVVFQKTGDKERHYAWHHDF